MPKSLQTAYNNYNTSLVDLTKKRKTQSVSKTSFLLGQKSHFCNVFQRTKCKSNCSFAILNHFRPLVLHRNKSFLELFVQALSIIQVIFPLIASAKVVSGVPTAQWLAILTSMPVVKRSSPWYGNWLVWCSYWGNQEE